MDKACKDFVRKNPTATNSTDGEIILGNFQADTDRRDVDNIPSTANLPDSSCGACNSDDPKAQKAAAAELPKPPVTFCGCCTNSTNCLSQAYRKSKVSRSNLSRAANACFDFSSHVRDDLTDCDSAGDDQDSLRDSDVAVFPSSVTLGLQFSFPAFSMNLSRDASR